MQRLETIPNEEWPDPIYSQSEFVWLYQANWSMPLTQNNPYQELPWK